jgi:sugar phosphate isomerase/epimerase
VSCHLKDILLKPEYTFQLQECACGEGTLDLELYTRLASAEDPRMPMIIEHLSSDDEYVTSVQYMQQLIHKKQN